MGGFLGPDKSLSGMYGELRAIAGPTLDAHPLLTGFTEGNGKAAGLPKAEMVRGSGPGVTWDCAVDANIANRKPDCSARWRGGDFGTATAAPVVHFNGLTGDVVWDVTADVQAGTTGWLIKKTHKGHGLGRPKTMPELAQRIQAIENLDWAWMNFHAGLRFCLRNAVPDCEVWSDQQVWKRVCRPWRSWLR